MGGMNIFRGQNGEVEDYLPKNPLAAAAQGAVLGASDSLPIQAIMAVLRGAGHAFTAPGRAVAAVGQNRAGLGPHINPLDAALYGRDMDTSGLAPASYGTLLQKTALGEDDQSKLGDVIRFGGDVVGDPLADASMVGGAGSALRAAQARYPKAPVVESKVFPKYVKSPQDYYSRTPGPAARPEPAAVKAPGDVWPGEPANEATHARFFREQNEFGPQSSRPAVGETSRAAMDEGAPLPKVKQTGRGRSAPRLRETPPPQMGPEIPADQTAKAQEAALADEGAAAIERGDNVHRPLAPHSLWRGVPGVEPPVPNKPTVYLSSDIPPTDPNFNELATPADLLDYDIAHSGPANSYKTLGRGRKPVLTGFGRAAKPMGR